MINKNYVFGAITASSDHRASVSSAIVGVDDGNDSDAATDADSAANDDRFSPLVASEAEAEEDMDEKAEEPWRRRMSLDTRRTCCMAFVLQGDRMVKFGAPKTYELRQHFNIRVETQTKTAETRSENLHYVR